MENAFRKMKTGLDRFPKMVRRESSPRGILFLRFTYLTIRRALLEKAISSGFTNSYFPEWGLRCRKSVADVKGRGQGVNVHYIMRYD